MFQFGHSFPSDQPGFSQRDITRGRFDELVPIAVVDIGSNSVRLVVYEGAIRAPTPLFNEKVLCGLGRALKPGCELDKKAVERALAALRRFRALVRTIRAKNVHVIATAAVREASDGDDFIARATAAIGVPITVLSGEREAELAAQGIRMGFLAPDGVAGDLGGGSLELINITDQTLSNAVTLPLGGLRMIDRSKGDLATATRYASDVFKDVSWLSEGKRRTFYAVGGTWRSLAKLHMTHTGYPLRVMHGYEVAADEMIAFCREARKPRKTSQIMGFDTISKARRELLPFGAMALERLLLQLKADRVVFSVFGIREGLLYSFLPETERQRDPLISFSEDYARLRSRSVRHAYELIAWTDPLFGNRGLDETPGERRLRAAACLLSDIGWRAHPDYRGEQSLNVIAHAALAGIDHPGRLFLALSVYFRHAGAGEMAGEGFAAHLRQLAGDAYVYRARIIAEAVRVAHMLSAGMAGIIDEIPLVLEGDDVLALNIPPAYEDLQGERLQRRFKALADLMGRKARICLTD